jgi:uncharacterized lipoprotein YddW (UPF0748 family)
MTHTFRTALLVTTAALLGVASATAAGKTPGRIGAYLRLNEEVVSSNALHQAMKHIKATGIDFIIPLAKESNVFWDSQVAPAEVVTRRTYLPSIVAAAHAAGLQVHPQFCVCTEGGEKSPNALLKAHPSWAYFYDSARRGYIDPGNPEARAYEAALAAEMVRKYDVDGLSLDYCRCPSHVGYTDSGRAEFLKKYQVDLAKVVGTISETPDTESGKKALAKLSSSARTNACWPEWQKWKAEQVTALAREIRAAVHQARPGLPISSYVWGYNTYANHSEVAQDWMRWIHEGLLDWINPSGYRYTDEAFLEAARLNRAHVPKDFPFYITIGVHTSHGSLKDAAEVRKQMTMARQCGADGVVFFTWEALRPFADTLAGDIKAYGQGSASPK